MQLGGDSALVEAPHQHGGFFGNGDQRSGVTDNDGGVAQESSIHRGVANIVKSASPITIIPMSPIRMPDPY